jgi:hypothetical protein
MTRIQTACLVIGMVASIYTICTVTYLTIVGECTPEYVIIIGIFGLITLVGYKEVQ